MPLEILPTRTAGAAENMAVDFLLLQRYPEERAASPRFRHYGWRGPAFTFGYSQKIAWVREQLAAEMENAATRVELCRRQTGGGIVDHRDDWTYTLVIPRGHPLEEVRASESYRAIHTAIAGALQAQGVPALVKPCEDSCDAEPEEKPAQPGVCFTRAETFDVIHADTGAKIAGAAQKRTKHGLLFQGSLWKPGVSPIAVDWAAFETALVEQLATALGTEAQPMPWPDLADNEVEGLTERYSATEWNEYR